MLSVNVKTWACTNPNCRYTWQFEGEAASTTPFDLTMDQLKQQFPEKQFFGLLPGKCPSCWMNGTSHDLYLSDDTSLMSTIHVASNDDLAAQELPDTDDSGVPIMEQIDVRKVPGVVDGQLTIVEEPVMAQKYRNPTEEELQALKVKRDEALRKVDDVGVAEVEETESTAM